MSDIQYDVIVGAGCGGAGLLARWGLSVPAIAKNNAAGGTGIGSRQAIMSGFNVAYTVEKRHGTDVSA